MTLNELQENVEKLVKKKEWTVNVHRRLTHLKLEVQELYDAVTMNKDISSIGTEIYDVIFNVVALASICDLNVEQQINIKHKILEARQSDMDHVRKNLDQPARFTAHNFSPCDNFGGQAHGDWCMLYKHGPVFMGFKNHKWGVSFSSDPNADWQRGSQDSCVPGDCLPQSSTARLLALRYLPVEAQEHAMELYNEAVEKCSEILAADFKKRASAQARTKQEKKDTYHKEVRQPWISFAKESK